MFRPQTAEQPYNSLWVCPGPPWCDLKTMRDTAERGTPCTFCTEIRLADDGTQRVIEPGHA